MGRLVQVFKLFLIAFVGGLCLMSYRADFCLFLGSFPAIKNNLYCLQPRKIHIFIDYATTPTLLQMIEFIKLPSQDIKIIAWDRYKNRRPLTKGIQLNVTEWTLPLPFDGHVKFIQDELKKIMNRYVKPRFYLHLNYKHIGWGGYTILQALPLTKVKELHLYEDGMGTFIRDYHKASSDTIVESIQTYIKDNQMEEKSVLYFYDSPYLNILPYLYPTYLHAMWNERTPPLTGATLVSVDFAALKKKLSDTEKEKLFHLFQFNPLDYKKQLQNKKMGIYLYDGFDSSDRENAVSTLKSDLLKMNNVVWFSKQHPRVHGTNEKTKGFIPIGETFIPLEAFLLSDLPLQYVAGEGSSAFYSVPPEMVVGYVPNPRHFYVQHLLNLKVLTSDKIYNWVETEKPESAPTATRAQKQHQRQRGHRSRKQRQRRHRSQ